MVVMGWSLTGLRFVSNDPFDFRIIEENGFHAAGRFECINEGLCGFPVVGRVLIGNG
jgi:hypothetical protein